MRFDIALSELSHLVAREDEFGIDLKSVRSHVGRMIGDEERIFRIFERLVESRQLNIREGNQLKQVSNASMAAMDRAQADALKSLSKIEDALLADKNRLLDAYGKDLERSANFDIEVLSNSLDHIESDGWIGIVCRFGTDRPGFVCINFFDNGPGIDNHIRPRVFDLFFTAKAGGTGVGLASVKRSVERHGGEVAVLNNEGGGAHIRFLLPVA